MNIFDYLAASVGLAPLKVNLFTLMSGPPEPSASSLVGTGTVDMMVVGEENVA